MTRQEYTHDEAPYCMAASLYPLMSKGVGKIDMTRQEYNRFIIDTLSKLVEKNPDLRFGQILVDSEIIKVIPSDKQLLAEDPFYEESKTTWERMLMNKFAFHEQYN